MRSLWLACIAAAAAPSQAAVVQDHTDRTNQVVGSLYGDGSDGPIHIISPKVLNTYHYVEDATFGPGPVTIHVDTTQGLSEGDLVIVYQSQADRNVGGFEFAWVTYAEVGGKTVTLSALQRSYVSGNPGVNAPQARSAQLVQVRQYSDVSITPAGSILASAWDGKKGGVICVLCSGMLFNDGLISARAMGYRGGGGDNAETDRQATPGESLRGLGRPSSGHRPNDGGGGGGETPSNTPGAGGGGGGSHTAGGTGHHPSGAIAGQGGLDYPSIALGHIGKGMGSGGGGGSTDWSNPGHKGQSGGGGRGGGVIILHAQDIDLTPQSRIDVSGANGHDGSGGQLKNGGGGGGAGGRLILVHTDGLVDRAQLLAQGGRGGKTSGGGNKARGGRGGRGEIEVIRRR